MPGMGAGQGLVRRRIGFDGAWRVCLGGRMLRSGGWLLCMAGLLEQAGLGGDEPFGRLGPVS